MTDIDDKALDELEEEAGNLSAFRFPTRANEFIELQQDAITALRARVKEWWDYCDELQQRNDELRVALGWAKTEARQVTREQSEKFVGLLQQYMDTADAHDCAYAALSELRFEILDDAGFVGSEPSKSNDTKIVEEAPKAEGRECDCLPNDGGEVYGTYYVCKRVKNCVVPTRCTEGERDETR